MGCGVPKELEIVLCCAILTDFGLLDHRLDAYFLSRKRCRWNKPTFFMPNFSFQKNPY